MKLLNDLQIPLLSVTAGRFLPRHGLLAMANRKARCLHLLCTGVSFGLLLLLGMGGSVLALDLPEMQRLAVENREVIKRYQVQVAKSGTDLERAQSGYYPALTVGYTLNKLDEDGRFEHRENSSFYTTLSMNLFSGFQDKYAIKSAKILEQVERHRLKGMEQDIQLLVALRYLNVYESQASLKVASDAHKTLDRIYTDGKRRLDVGLIGDNELLKFKVDLDNANITEQKRRADLDKNIQLLGRTINKSIGIDELSFDEFVTLPTVGDEEQCQTTMLSVRSEILALKGLHESSAVQVKVEQGAYYPRLDIVGSYSRYDDDYINGNGEASDEEFRAQLLLSLNVFDGFARESAVSKAKLAVRELVYDRAELENSLKTDLANLFIDYRVSLANVEVAKEDIIHAEENLRITQLKYKEGLQRESDLLDAVTNLSRARYNQVAVYRALFANAFRITRMVEAFQFRSSQ